MPIITIAEVKQFLNISAAETLFDLQIGTLIPVVTERIYSLCNNPFTVQPIATSMKWFRGPLYGRENRDSTLYVLSQASATFVATTQTVTAVGENFASAQFAAGQDIFVRDSYLNDGYFYVSSVSTSSLTIATSYTFANAIPASHTFIDEATGASIFFGVVKWPIGIKPIVASLIQYDYQDRGSWSEDSRTGHGEFGYPTELLRPLATYTVPAFGSE